MESKMEILQKTKIRTTIGSINTIPGHISKECAAGYDRATCIPCLLLPSLGTSPAAPQLINGLENVVYINTGILFDHKEEL
jgi:hypothetical protein